MGKCIVLSRPSNNTASKLYDEILTNIAKGDEEYANELINYFDTEAFISDFGDWRKDYETRAFNEFSDAEDYRPPIVGSDRIYITTGEPRLSYDAAEDFYYYVNKNGTRRPFPLKKKGLDTIYSGPDILAITEMLGANYIDATIGNNFTDLKFSGIQEVLSKSIERKINQVIDDLRELADAGDEDAEIKMYDLEDSLAFIDEWEARVKDYFQSKKLIYKEEGNADVMEVAEESPRDPNYSVASFERSTKENISTNVKLRLSVLRDETTVDPLFGEPVLVPFNAVYSILLSRLNNKVAITDAEGNIENLYDIFVKEIEQLAIRKPFLNSLLRQLKGEDEFGNKVTELDPNIKKEFVQAFNLHKNNFISTDITRDDDGNYFVIMDISNSGSKARSVHAQWYDNFRAIYAPGTAYGASAPNFNQLVTIQKELEIIKKEFKRKVNLGLYENEAEAAKPIGYLKETLGKLGVPITDKALDLYLDDLQLAPQPLAERMKKLNDTFNDLERWTKSIVTFKNDPTKSNILDDQKIFNQMAQAETFYMTEETDATVYSAGKTKWLFSNPTYLSTKILVWKRNPELLYNLLQTEYGSSSLFAKYLLALDVDEGSRERERQKRLNELDITTFNTLQETGTENSEAVDNKSIPKNDFTADSINKSLQTIPYYYTPTPADKGTHYMLKIGKKIKVAAEYSAATKSIRVSEEVEKIFLDYFASEYARIAKVHRDIETIDSKYQTVHYHTGAENGLKSQLFPTLSPENWEKVKKNYSFTLYDAEGKPKHSDLTKLVYTEKNVKEKGLDPELIGRNKIIHEFIAPLLSENIQRTYEDMFKKSIFEKMEDGSIFAHGVDKGIVADYKGDGRGTKQYALRITADALINGIISQVEYAKLFAGDMAFYKNPVDYKKRIPATYTDGLQLTLEPGQEKFNIAVTDSVEVPSPYLDRLKETLPERIWKHYTNINSADAQAWITPQRWKFLMEGLGKWSNTYQRIYDKMMSGEEYTLEPSELKKVAQPLKGVYFDINKGNTPVYLKYSQAVLIPQLIKDTPLQRLYDKMVLDENGKEKAFNDQIHETITIDGVKVGAITPVKSHNADGTMADEYELTTMTLKNSGWKLQQDLPTKTFKMTNIGTQLQKNIFAGLANNPDEVFNVGGKDMTGIELYHHMNRIVKSLSDKGKGALIAEFDIRTGNKIGNYSRVYKAMIDELKSRGGNKDIISALEKGLTPYGIPQAKKTLMNIFSSIMLKNMVKVQTNGGAFIQLSNFGISKSEGDNRGVIWSPALANGDTAHEPHFLKDENGEFIMKKVRKINKDIPRAKVAIYKGTANTKQAARDGKGVYVMRPNPKDNLPGVDENNNYGNPFSHGGYNGTIKTDTVKNAVRAYRDWLKGVDAPLSAYGIKSDKNLSDIQQEKRNWILNQINSGALNGKNLLYFKPGYTSHADVLANMVDLASGAVVESEQHVVRPGGVLISGSFIAKYVPDYRKYASDPERLFGRYNKAKGRYESYVDKDGNKVIPLIDNNIIQGLIGYRIPNQGLASNDGLEIVGILPEAAGDTVVAYTGITTKTGSDFDIDKMYMMMPSFIPYRGMKSRLINHLKEEFKGDKLEDVIENINLRIEELGISYDVSGLAKELMSKKEDKETQYDEDGEVITLNEMLSEFVEAIQDSNPELENEFAREIRTIAKEDGVERLIYYRPEKGVPMERQSKGVLNNQLIEAYRAVLLSPHTIEDVMTPIDFEFMKSDINTLFKKDKPSDLDDFNPFKDIDLKYEFMAGKAGVGQEANALVDHNRGRMADTYFYKMYLGRGSFIEVDGIKSSTLDKEYSEEISDTDLRLYLNAINEQRAEEGKDPLKLEDVADLKKIKIADSLSAVLNAFVDIAKDPYITRGNWTTQTTNTGNMLLRAGFHPFYVNAFLGQPSVRKYIEYVTTKESKIIRDTGDLKDKFRFDIMRQKLNDLGSREEPKALTFDGKTKNYNTIYSSLVKKGPDMEIYRESVREGKPKDTSLSNFTLKSVAALFGVADATKLTPDQKMLFEDVMAEIKEVHDSVFFTRNVNAKSLKLGVLREQITDPSKEDSAIQMAVLNQFFEWQDNAKTLRHSVMASKLDVDGYGKSIGELVAMDNSIAKLLKPVKLHGDFVGFDEKLIKDGKLTLLGAYKRNIIDWTKDVMQANPIMFFEAQPYVINTFNEIAKDVKEDLLTDPVLAADLEKGYYNYLMSGFPPLKTTFEEKADLIVNFPQEFKLFKEKNEAANKLIAALTVKPGSDNKSYIQLSNREKDTQYEEELIAAWQDLLDRPATKEFAEKLIKYSYLTSGFAQHTTQFFTYIPTSWFIENFVDNYLIDNAKKMNQWDDRVDVNFIDQFYRNNMHDGRFVPYVPAFMTEMIEGDTRNTGFVLKQSVIANHIRKYVKRKGFSGENSVDYLYKLIGFTANYEGIYMKVSPLSARDRHGNRIIEYKYRERMDESDLGANSIILSKKAKETLERYKAFEPNKFTMKIETGEIELIDDVERAELEKLDDAANC